VESINIRYDGRDAASHLLELSSFGKSASGISKIMSTVVDFAITSNYQQNKKNQSCKILVGSPKDNCVSFQAIIQYINQSQILSGISVFLICGLMTYLWGKIIGVNNEKLQKEILEELKKVNQNLDEQRFITTIDRMVEDLMPAAKNAVHPINISCDTISFIDNQNNYFVKLGSDEKKAINERKYDYSELEQHKVIISEIDMKKATCMVSLKDDLMRRFKAKIVDPQIQNANNDYGLATNSKAVVTITAKQKLFKGVVKEFVISDINLNYSQGS
jgi:hypothetical protein